VTSKIPVTKKVLLGSAKISMVVDLVTISGVRNRIIKDNVIRKALNLFTLLILVP